MEKKVYYYKNDNGEEVKARTSTHEYHYICMGKCSKTYEGAYAEKTRRVNELKRSISFYTEMMENEKARKRHMKMYGIRQSEEDMLNDYRRYLEWDQDMLDNISTAKVYELYTK